MNDDRYKFFEKKKKNFFRFIIKFKNFLNIKIFYFWRIFQKKNFFFPLKYFII
jgi:hypothetical protein